MQKNLTDMLAFSFTYRRIFTYFLIFQVISIAFGVPVFVRKCQMKGTERAEIGVFVKKDTCCAKKQAKKDSLCKIKTKKNKKKAPLYPCCSFETSIWQADLEQNTHFEAGLSTEWLILFVLPLVRAFCKRFFVKNTTNNLFSSCFLLRPPPIIPFWLRFRCIIR